MKVQFEFKVRFEMKGRKSKDVKVGTANPYVWDPALRNMDVRYSAWR